MKFLCLLLSLYVLLLSARPCCTDDVCINKSTSTTFSAKTSAAQKDCTGCSPFFSCSTCAGFIVAKPMLYTGLMVTENLFKPNSIYRQPYVQQVAQSIWQPPKIG